MSRKELGPDEFLADDGSPITKDEAIAIGQLERLARQWPKTLRLVSMDGELYVIRNDDKPTHEHAEQTLTHIIGIPNDGGGW